MSLLTKAYNSENAPSIATIMVSIGTALLFSVGVFLIMNAQFGKQANQLESAQSSINELADKKDGEFDTITVENETTLNGDVTAEADLTVSGSSNLEGDTTIGGDLEVAGKGDIRTLLTIDGDTSLGDTLAVQGKTQLNGDLDVTGAATLQAGLSITGDTTIGDSISIGGSASVGGDFDVVGTTKLNGSLSVAGDLSFDSSGVGSSFTLQGAVNLTGDLAISGTTVLQQSLTLVGAEATTTFDVSAAGSSFTLQGNANLTGDLEVAGATLINGNLNLTAINNTSPEFSPSTIFSAVGSDALGNSILLGSSPSFQVAKDVSLQGDLEANGTTNILGNLTLTAASIANADFSPTSTFNAVGSQTVSGNTSDILLGGASSTSFAVALSVSLQGDLEVSGTTSIGGSLTVAVDPANVSNLDFNPTHTFTAMGNDALGNSILLGTGTSFAVAGNATLAGDIDQKGSASFGSLNGGGDGGFDATLEAGGFATLGTISTAFGNITPSFIVQGATSIAGDQEFDGTTFFANTLTVNGASEITGDMQVICTLNCTNNALQVGGRLSAEQIYGSDRVSALEFGYNPDGASYRAGATFSCAANFHLEIRNLVGGIALGDNNSNTCVRNQSNSSGSVSNGGPVGVCTTSPAQHIQILEITDGLITGQNGCQTGADLAENYASDQQLVAGDVVALDSTKAEFVIKTSGAHDDKVIGVVSTQPGIVIGDSAGYPIALAGRVPVKVTDEGGAIVPGDYLTSASLSGYAKKAAPGEKTIGQALESFTGTIGTVKMFVNVSPAGTTNQATVQGAQSLQQGDSASFASLNVSGASILSDLQVTGTTTTKDLVVTGVATVAKLVISGHIIGNDDTRGVVTIPTGSITAHFTFTSAYDSVPTIVASPIGQSVLYSITPTETGFDITTPSPAVSDIKFNYLAQQ